jgi:hypothetical protein
MGGEPSGNSPRDRNGTLDVRPQVLPAEQNPKREAGRDGFRPERALSVTKEVAGTHVLLHRLLFCLEYSA